MIRKARMSDVKTIQNLIAEYAKKGDMLPRSLSDIYENLRDYFVFQEDGGEVVGSAAIHIMWEDLAEVRSLAVRDGSMRRGIGTQLVEACISEAIVLGITRVFALTYKPEFFEKLGFRKVDKAELPHKIWTDCLKCAKFPDCDEVALVADFSGSRRGA
ncbi:MAG: N-acetyltransferase [Deltaproteobacteria bacterium]|nr:MAG: N-acetyltransferase [Deltaproteobacteria bacterium]